MLRRKKRLRGRMGHLKGEKRGRGRRKVRGESALEAYEERQERKPGRTDRVRAKKSTRV